MCTLAPTSKKLAIRLLSNLGASASPPWAAARSYNFLLGYFDPARVERDVDTCWTLRTPEI